jgi:hypothetical protein
VKFLGFDLQQDRSNKNDSEDSRANKVPSALRLGSRFTESRHGYGVARGFAERCREDFNNPE